MPAVRPTVHGARGGFSELFAISARLETTAESRPSSDIARPASACGSSPSVRSQRPRASPRRGAKRFSGTRGASRLSEVSHSAVGRATLGRFGGHSLRAFDFFCGAGGLTRGLLDAGVDVLCGVDNDSRLRETYELNNSPSVFECVDIADVSIGAMRSKYGVSDDDIVLYAACTPCQPFSTLNQRRGQDNRKDLLTAFGDLVRAAPPDFLLVENVPGLGNAYGREIYAQFLALLDKLGFDSDARKLDACDYGVPQTRKRFILIASRHGPIQLPAPDEGAPQTVRDAIGSIPPIGSAEAPPNHVFREPKPHHVAILREVPPDGGSRADVKDTSVLLDCHRRRPSVHKDVFGRMSWNAPAPTLTCRCTDVYCGRFAHPIEDRGMTLREAAAIQTFSPGYEFRGTFFHMAAQIGNAVPVKLAERLGGALLRAGPAGTA
jgi:DNA (cytosine-5)-methyltransferase 1